MAVQTTGTGRRNSGESPVENASTRPTEDGIHRAMTASPESGRPSRTTSPVIFNPYYTGRPRTPTNSHKPFAVDRREIIRQIKVLSRPTSPELERRKSPVPVHVDQISRTTTPQTPERRQNDEEVGMQIERPRSALHRGDFREREGPSSSGEGIDGASRALDTRTLFATSPVVPWDSRFPANALRYPGIFQTETKPNGIPIPAQRARAPSYSSFSSSFVYRPPTSPLVQSSRPDTPDQSSRMRSRSPDKTRRHTFSPTYMYDYSSHRGTSPPGLSHAGVPTLRSERSYPCQALQPERPRIFRTSASLPQSPMGHTRRTSLSDSPLHHAPMVGSYEESILRGRMSTTPSKPLNFVAQIGVLGKGNCKPSLRCPSHVSIPFPAVFYSYGNGGKVNPTNDQPSPYVGLIDLENNLQTGDASERRRRQNFQTAMSPAESRAASRSRIESVTVDDQAHQQQRRRQKQKRRSGSPRAPPGGCYRIPAVGQLQIVIKNPNKTAVKLFLVPYDLSDMEPGQKTFIRQRSYSAGPIIDMPLSSRKNLGTDRPEAGINPSGDPQDKPILRYLIHLNICCPAKGRYFLYKSLRVVFANRVPDGKEKLRNEVQMPDPRYSTYKITRDPPAAVIAATPPNPRRRSSILDPQFSPIQETQWSPFSHHFSPQSPAPNNPSQDDLSAFTSIPPRHFSVLPTLASRPQSRHALDDDMDLDPPSDQHHPLNTGTSLISSPSSPPTSANPRHNHSPFTHFSAATFHEPFGPPESRGRRTRGRDMLGRSEPSLPSPPHHPRGMAPFAPSATDGIDPAPYRALVGIDPRGHNSGNFSSTGHNIRGSGSHNNSDNRPPPNESLLSRRLMDLDVVGMTGPSQHYHSRPRRHQEGHGYGRGHGHGDDDDDDDERSDQRRSRGSGPSSSRPGLEGGGGGGDGSGDGRRGHDEPVFEDLFDEGSGYRRG
ncbi:uncharacterized protein K489DRAFT_379232 [Dissoconium aciculare CBS 342.82]|uniref:Atos-like conserved domain-containing protein n=1 Tax=Dissoconium aciculare CBS 342.82 TaxID=1314786 RepID=A0A6J3M8U1_9PEZI|nr:uncharacterized protein K489DRAFT_379232 [Dissoconium aciculare CBS 342.82]KAF1823252.1 hypothetical protein K489DRAFT_379232 [Dissoconium aciculare CBS 342.82]